jgi:STE24 endopeptidase
MDTSPESKTLIEHPVLNQDRQKKARIYSSIRRRLSLGEMSFSLALLLVLILTSISRRFIGSFDWPEVPSAVVFFLGLTLAYELITSPLSYFNGFILPRRYGISTQSLRSWIGDLAKGGSLGLAFGSAAVAIAYWLLLSYPAFWWLLAWGLMIIVTVIMSVIGPVILVPLFYKVKPLADSELRLRLEQLAKSAGAKVHGIYTLDFSSKGTTANAALMGMGGTRRIVVSDTLTQGYTVSEIEVVTAHEIGHHLHRDILRAFVVQSALYLIGLKIIDVILKAVVTPLGYNGIADPAALPILLLLFGVLAAVISPLINTYSRHLESQADGYALKLTDDSGAFVDAMTRLVNQNLAVADPPHWEELLFYSHPSYNRRIEQARAYNHSRGGTLNPK